MNHPDFTQLRRLIDEAITYNDLVSAEKLAKEGLGRAQSKECLGEIMYFQAQFEIIHERFHAAIKYLEKALEHNPLDGAAYNDLGLCRIELGIINGVEDLFNKGIAVEPDYATIHHNKGWFLNKLGRYEEALVSFTKALDLEPDRTVTYENMADTYESLGRAKEALNAYQQALRLIKSSSAPIKLQIEAEIQRLSNKDSK